MTVMHAVTKFRVVGIGGSTRRQSSGELALGYGVRIAERDGARTKLIAAEDLQLPMYDPAPTAQNPQASRIFDLVYRTDSPMIASRGAQGGALMLVALRWVMHALRGWPTPLGMVVDSSTPAFEPDDEPLQGTTRTQLEIMTTQLLAAAKQRKLDQHKRSTPGWDQAIASQNDTAQP